MLQAMRSSSKSVIAVLMFVILIVTFAVWGIGDIFRNTARDPVAAEVADIKIYAREVRERFNQELERAQQAGQPMSFEQAVKVGLPNLVLDRLVGDALRAKVAGDKGLTITDDYLRAVIAGEPSFRNQLGIFDRQIYAAFLQRIRLSEGQHLAQLRRDFGASQLFNTLQESLPVPNDYRDLVYRFRFERRVAQTTLLPLSAIGEPPKPGDEALQTYYEANKTRFGLPEYRKLAYVYVKADDVLAEIKISDQKIKEEYEIRRNEYTTPESRDVDQVLLDSEEKARQLADLLAKGTPFADATKQVMGPTGGVIPLGEVTKTDLPPGLGDPTFELKENGTTQPIRSPLGWHIMKVNKITPPVVKPLDAVKAQIVEALKRAQAPDLLVARANDLERQLNRGTPLEEAARGIAATMKTIDAIDANGGGANGLPATDIANVREMTRRAFNLRKGDESALTELANGDFFVVQVLDVMPARIPELAEIKDKVTAAWQQAEIAKLAEAKAKALVEKANAGADFAALMKAEKLELVTTPPFTRNVNDPKANMPSELAAALFGLTPGKAAYGATDAGVAIARLQEIQPADAAKDAAGLEATHTQMANSMREAVLFALDAALRQRYPVVIDNAVMAQTFAVER